MIYKTLILIWTICSSLWVSAQSPDFKMTSMDEEFSIELVREDKIVKAIIIMPHPEAYSHVVLERLMGEPPQFRQVSYIDKGMLAAADNGTITANDMHPAKFIDDSFYRLRTVSVENIERVYPSLRLPAIKATKALSAN